jgi:hypothetical protein
MGYKIQFDTGHTVEFNAQPTEADIEEAFHAVKSTPLSSKQESPSVGKWLSDAYSVKHGQAMNAADAAISFPAGALAASFGDDTVMDEFLARRKNMTKETNPNNTKLSTGQEIVGSLLTAPQQLLGMLGQAAEKGMDLVDRGESTGTAQLATGAEALLSSAGLGPMKAVANPIARASLGAVTNMATGMGSDAITQMLASKKETKEAYNPYNLEKRIVEGVTGGILQGALGERPNKKPALSVKPKADLSGLEQDIKAKKEAIEQPTESTIGTPEGEQARKNIENVEALRREKELQRMSAFNAPEAQGLVKESPMERTARELGGEPLPREREATPFSSLVDTLSSRSTPEQWKAQDAIDTRQQVMASEVTRQTALDQNATFAKNHLNIEQQRLTGVPSKVDEHPMVRAAEERLTKGEELLIKVSGMKEEGRATSTQVNRVEKEVRSLEAAAQKVREKITTALTAEAAGTKLTPQQRWGKQAGAINVSGIIEGMEKLRAGVISARDYLETFRGTFSDTAIDTLISDHEDPKSRSTIMLMSPQEFKDLAKKRTVINQKDWTEKTSSIKEGLASKSGLRQIPQLFVDEGKLPNSTKVWGHEGRHRADVFQQMGIDLIPVEVRHSSLRWGEAEQGNSIPKQIIGEEKISYRDTPTRVDSKVPFNFKNQGGGILFDFSKKKKDDTIASRLLSGPFPELYPTDGTPESIIASLKGAKDIKRGDVGKIIGEFTPSLYEKLKTNHPLFKYTYDQVSAAVDTATSRVNKLINNELSPKLRSLSKEDFTSVWDALMLGMKNREDISPDMLSKHGFSPEQIDVFTTVKELHKSNLDQLNKSRELAGKPPVDAFTGYITGLATGNFRRVIYKMVPDSNGSMVPEVVGIVGSDFRPLMEKRIAAILEAHPEWQAGPERFNGMRKTKQESTRVFQDALTILEDNNPHFQEFKTAIEEIMKAEGYDALGAKKHTMSKKGIFGMEGDKLSTTPYQNAIDGFNAQIRYTQTMSKWAALSEAVDNISKIISDPEVQKNHPYAIEMSERLLDNAMGMNPSNVGRIIDDFIGAVGEKMGVGPSVFKHTAKWARNTVNGIFFGMNAPWLVTNYLQPFMVSPEMKSFLSQRGIEVSIDPTGWSDIASKGTWSSFKHVSGMPETTLEKAMWTYAKEHGIDQTQLFSSPMDVRPDVSHYTKKTLKLGADYAEAHPRSIMFATFVQMLADSGYGKDPHLFDVARQITDMAMTDYRHEFQMPLNQHAGMAGEITSNLTSFKQNTLSRYAMFAREMGDGNYKAFLTAALSAFALGGILGFPGFTESDELVKLYSKIKGAPTSLTKMVLDLADEYNQKYKGVGDAFAMGVAGYFGVDMHNRWSMPSVMPSVTGGMGKAVDITSAVGDVAKYKDDWSVKNLARQVAPYPAQVAMDNTWYTITNPDGSETALNRRGNTTMDRNDADRLFKKFGLTGSNEARIKAQDYAVTQQDQWYREKQTLSIEKLQRAEGNWKGNIPDHIFNAYMQEYIEVGGDPANWVKQAEKVKLNSNLTTRGRRFLQNQSGSYSATQKLQRGYVPQQ